MRMKILFLLLSLFLAHGMNGYSTGSMNPLDTVVHFSPPSTQIYLGSPSIQRLENGDLLAAMDMFGPQQPEPTVSLIFRSRDDGKRWEYVTEIRGSFWANLFLHNHVLYYLGTSNPDASILIRRSDDSGESWTEPVDENTGLLFPYGENASYHCAPMPVVLHEGRLYRAFENNPEKKWPAGFRSLVISADANVDLLKASSWVMSNQLVYDQQTDPPDFAGGKVDLPGGLSAGWLEGNVVVTPDGGLVNILRVNSTPVVDRAAVVKIFEQGKRVEFDPKTGFIEFPGGMSKFAIRRDDKSGRYWTLTNNVTNPNNPRQRNVLSLYSSVYPVKWTHHDTLLEDESDFEKVGNDSKVGFQYVDFQFDGDDIIFLSRTALKGAHNYHDANFMTFHRIGGFRGRYKGSDE